MESWDLASKIKDPKDRLYGQTLSVMSEYVTGHTRHIETLVDIMNNYPEEDLGQPHLLFAYAVINHLIQEGEEVYGHTHILKEETDSDPKYMLPLLYFLVLGPSYELRDECIVENLQWFQSQPNKTPHKKEVLERMEDLAQRINIH